MDQTSLSQWEPSSPLLSRLSDAMRSGRSWLNKAAVPDAVPVLGGQGVGDMLLGRMPEGVKRIAYDEPLTTGSGETLHLHPDMEDLATAPLNFVNPGAGAGGRVARMAAKDVERSAVKGFDTAAAQQGVDKLVQSLQRNRDAGTGATGMLRKALPADANPGDYYARPTVTNPQRVAYPDVYLRPDELVARTRVAPEDPALKRLFGVDRHDLYDISQGGTRAGTFTDIPFDAPANPRGSASAFDVMNPRNEQRLLDIMGESLKNEPLTTGMVPWYTMDPMYPHFKRLWGDQAPEQYRRFNNMVSMFSPQSEVNVEINRGTAANWLEKQGRMADFIRYGGKKGQPGSPLDMAGVPGHMGHSTSQLNPVMKYLNAGGQDLQMDSAKVPSYAWASGVPEAGGFQTKWPVGDAHWSRLVGLPDTRGAVKDPNTGLRVPNAANATVAEMSTLGPWWRGMADQAGLESVSGQALVWGAGSHATGVTSPIGAPKLELLSQQIMKTAQRLGISPEEARDRVIMGQTYAGLRGNDTPGGPRLRLRARPGEQADEQEQ